MHAFEIKHALLIWTDVIFGEYKLIYSGLKMAGIQIKFEMHVVQIDSYSIAHWVKHKYLFTN